VLPSVYCSPTTAASTPCTTSARCRLEHPDFLYERVCADRRAAGNRGN
jgi:hypothetical protein